MQESVVKSVQEEGETWFDGRPVLLHYKHLKAGTERLLRCEFCQHGMGAVVKAIEEGLPGAMVRESPGVDEEEPAPLSYDDWWAQRYPS